MIFSPANHQYKTELENELIRLEDFARRITCFQADSVISDVDQSVTVIFDDVSSPYIASNIDDNRKKLHEFWKDLLPPKNLEGSELVEVCGHIFDTFPRFNEWYDRLFNDQHWHDPEVRKKIKEIKNIILSSYEGYLVSGVYDASARTITLYTQNIDNNLVDYISVFAHEYFHAIHHFLIDANSKEVTDRYYHRVVLESLASFFQIEYLKTKGTEYQQKAAAIDNSLNAKSPVFYPYSGAKYIRNDFCDILEDSLHKFESSLRRLINNPFEAEIILQKKYQPKIRGRQVNRQNTPIGELQPTVDQKRPVIPECPSIFSPNTRIGNVPVYLIPHNENTFKGLYEDGHPYVIVLYHADGRAEMIGPVKCNGKRIAVDMSLHVRSNSSLQKKDLSDISSILAIVLW